MHQRARPGRIVDATTRLADPLVAIGAAAVATWPLRLATGVYLLPLRHPLTTAQIVATVQELACGRFMFGVGTGWLQEEFDALGVPFDTRTSRFEEAIAILRTAWATEPLAHDGTHFRFNTIQLRPAATDVPLVLGGNSEWALGRAVRLGDAWYSSGTPTPSRPLERSETSSMALSHQAGRTDPPAVHVRVPKPDPECLASYERQGFDSVVVWANQLWPEHGS